MRCLTCKILTVLLAVASLSSVAQVGINTTSPDSTALLDIRFSGTGQVGVLLPHLSAAERLVVKGSVSDGMLVFDRKEKQLYYYDSTIYNPTTEKKGEWVTATPLGAVQYENGFRDIRPQDSTVNTLNITLGLPDSEKATAKLDVNGSVRVRDNLKVDSSNTIGKNLIVSGTATLKQNLQVAGSTTLEEALTVAGSTTLNSPTTINSTLTVNGNVSAGSNTITAQTVNAVNGNGIIPIGGIIMWSGTTPPAGWALCDGGSGTPNLQGRFIVGSGQSYTSDGRETSTPYYNVGSTGGRNMYALSTDEMPSHTHTITGYIGDDNVEGDGDANGHEGTNITMTSDATGGGGSHENRPPYYVLAFIMRVQ